VTSGRIKEDFIKRHIKETMNNGKKLLSLYILKKDGIDVYAGVWVSEGAFDRESKRLKKLGINPPEFMD